MQDKSLFVCISDTDLQVSEPDPFYFFINDFLLWSPSYSIAMNSYELLLRYVMISGAYRRDSTNSEGYVTFHVSCALIVVICSGIIAFWVNFWLVDKSTEKEGR